MNSDGNKQAAATHDTAEAARHNKEEVGCTIVMDLEITMSKNTSNNPAT